MITAKYFMRAKGKPPFCDYSYQMERHRQAICHSPTRLVGAMKGDLHRRLHDGGEVPTTRSRSVAGHTHPRHPG